MKYNIIIQYFHLLKGCHTAGTLLHREISMYWWLRLEGNWGLNWRPTVARPPLYSVGYLTRQSLVSLQLLPFKYPTAYPHSKSWVLKDRFSCRTWTTSFLNCGDGQYYPQSDSPLYWIFMETSQFWFLELLSLFRATVWFKKKSTICLAFSLGFEETAEMSSWAHCSESHWAACLFSPPTGPELCESRTRSCRLCVLMA